MSYTTEASFSSAIGLAEIRNYRWDSPLDETICDNEAVLGMSLSAVPKGSMARFRSASAYRHFSPVGKMLFRPAGVPMQCINAGGRQRLLMCSLATQQQSELVPPIVSSLEIMPPALDVRHAGMAAALRRLAYEVASPGFARAAMIEALMIALLVDFVRLNEPDRTARSHGNGGLAPWQFRRIDEALNDFEGTAPTVSDLATLAGVSARHLLRGFRSSRGTSVLAHITRVRLDRACTMLATTQLPVKLVAARCGFTSGGGFSAAFRREMGIGPKDFRTRERN